MPIHNETATPATPTFTEYNFTGAESQKLMSRDMTQSRRLHEPTFRKPLSDPMTGDDINNASNQPLIIDGNLTLYFTSEKTRKAYLNMPNNHPSPRLPYPATENDDRGG